MGFVPGVTQSVDWHGEVSLRQRVIVDKLVEGGPLHHVQQGMLQYIYFSPSLRNILKIPIRRLVGETQWS